MSKTLETERLTERLEVRLSESSYQFLKQQNNIQGKVYRISWIKW